MWVYTAEMADCDIWLSQQYSAVNNEDSHGKFVYAHITD